MSEVSFESSVEDGATAPLWFRASSSAVLVGAALGWASVIVACCLAAPLALVLGAGDDRQPSTLDDL